MLGLLPLLTDSRTHCERAARKFDPLDTSSIISILEKWCLALDTGACDEANQECECGVDGKPGAMTGHGDNLNLRQSKRNYSARDNRLKKAAVASKVGS